MAKKKIPKLDEDDDPSIPTHPDHPDLRVHIKEIQKALAECMSRKTSSPTAKPALRKYLARARAIPMLVHPFSDSKDILAEGITAWRNCNENEEPELPDLYEDICAIMPGGRFSDVLVGLSTRDVNATNAFLAYISKKAEEGMSATATKFKAHVLDYVQLDAEAPSSHPIASKRDKAFRGNNDNGCARAIAPFKDRPLFDKDPLSHRSVSQYRAKVDSGEIEITEENWSSFFFPEDARFDPMYPEKGFGMGHIFKRLLNCELVGPSGAYGDLPASFQDSIAARHDITKVTARIAAYIGYHAYVSLSSLPERSLEDGPMNLVAYYENIHALLTLDDRTGISQKLLDDMTASVPYILRRPKGKRKAANGTRDDRVRKNPVEEAIKARELRAESERLQRREQQRAQAEQGRAPQQGAPSNSRARGPQAGQAPSRPHVAQSGQPPSHPQATQAPPPIRPQAQQPSNHGEGAPTSRKRKSSTVLSEAEDSEDDLYGPDFGSPSKQSKHNPGDASEDDDPA